MLRETGETVCGSAALAFPVSLRWRFASPGQFRRDAYASRRNRRPSVAVLLLYGMWSLGLRAGDRTLRAPAAGRLRAKKDHFLPLAAFRLQDPRADLCYVSVRQGPHFAPPDLFLTVLQPLSSSLRQGARAGLSSSEPLSVPSVWRIVALGPRCPFRLCASCRARPGPAPSVAQLIRPVCLPLPAPPPGCGRIAWPKRGQLRPSWPAAKEHLAPCWAGGLCVHSRQAEKWHTKTAM